MTAEEARKMMIDGNTLPEQAWGALDLDEMRQIDDDTLQAVTQADNKGDYGAHARAKADRMICATLAEYPAILSAIIGRRAEKLAAKDAEIKAQTPKWI